MRLFALVLTFALLPGLAAAVPVYSGDLTDGALRHGTVDAAGWSNGPTAVDFYSYTGDVGDAVSLFTRNDSASGGLLVALYAGTTSGFDDFFATPPFFDTPFDWGGLTGLLQFELAAGASLLQRFLLPLTGQYTVIVGGSGFAPLGDGPIGYAVQAAAVPEPGVLVLFATALLAAPFARRSARRAQ